MPDMQDELLTIPEYSMRLILALEQGAIIASLMTAKLFHSFLCDSLGEWSRDWGLTRQEHTALQEYIATLKENDNNDKP